MYRLLIVALALIGLAASQSSIAGGGFSNIPDFPQAPIIANAWEGQVMQNNYYYFCHSQCSFNGNYFMARFWQEADPNEIDDTKIFDWSADGDLEFWNQFGANAAYPGVNDCDTTIDYFRYGPAISNGVGQTAPKYTLQELVTCQPTWIYIENVIISYRRDIGQFWWIHQIDKAYSPTNISWFDWASTAYNAKVGQDITTNTPDLEYDKFDGLLRFYPDFTENELTDKFSKDYYYKEIYIANYEPNFCSMQMPHNKIDASLYCNGHVQDDSDFPEFPTVYYCMARGANDVEQDEIVECTGQTDCSTQVRFTTFSSRRRSEPGTFTPTKTDRLRKATSNSRQLAQHEKRDPVSYFSPAGLFYQQSEIAGAAFPFCAFRGSSKD